MIKVGIVGVGTLGSELARWCVANADTEDVRLVGVVDIDKAREKKIRDDLKIKKAYTVSTLAMASDLIIEAASAGSAAAIVREAMSHGKDVMVMSSGGIIHKTKEIFQMAKDHRCCLYLPSGAIAGIDALKSANLGKIKSVSLTTRKPPIGFKDAPYLVKRKINVDNLNKETLLFEGSAERAIAGFPQNINVSATLSLAGIGAKRTKVKIYATPGLRDNIHEVCVEGEFGSFYTRTQNRPSAQNPKTSGMAILSAIATLKRILNNVKLGT